MNAHAHPVIRIQPALPAEVPAASGCGHCHHSSAGPVCRVEAQADCPAPQLSGPSAELARVLAALDAEMALVHRAQGQPVPVSRSGLLHALSLCADEAHLVLAIAPHCGGAPLAEAAFHTLRRLLPDRDIYVTHRVR